MEICIAGWYFEPELFEQFAQIKNKHHVTVLTDIKKYMEIKKDIDPIVAASGVDHWEIPFCGLEWHKYDHYIKNIWTEGQDVLFMHDDIRLSNISFFDKAAALECDQAFIFQNETESKQNQNFHGRAIFCKSHFIRAMLNYKCECGQSRDRHDKHHNIGTVQPGTSPHRGFWYDPYNVNHATGKPPVGVRHYNDGVYHFASFCKRLRNTDKLDGAKWITDCKVFFGEFEHGKRGVFKK